MNDFNIKTQWPLTRLERAHKNYTGFGDSNNNAQIELAARQLVLGDITKERAERGGWIFCDNNAFYELAKRGLAVFVYTNTGEAYEATDLLMSRQAEVLAKRVSFEVMAKNMAVTLPTKSKLETQIKINYKAKASIETLKEFIQDNENENAWNYAEAMGSSLHFGTGSGGANPYYDVKTHTIEGKRYFTGRDRTGSFSCISFDYALSTAGGIKTKTREDCIKALIQNIAIANSKDEKGFDRMCANFNKITQSELRADYLSENTDLRKAA